MDQLGIWHKITIKIKEKYMKRIIKNIIHKILDKRSYRAFINDYQTNTFSLPKSLIKKINKLGFVADEYVIYDLEHNDPREYISEYEREKYRRKVAGSFKILLDNKIVFYNMMRGFAPLNVMYGYKKNSEYVSFGDYDIADILQEKGKMIFKKTSGGGGHGFILLEYKDKQYFKNREVCSMEDIHNLLESENDYLLEEFCYQSDFENKIFPDAVNTIRIVTLVKESGEVIIIHALQRMGSKLGVCVDNASEGGIFATINIKDGTLSTATCSHNSSLVTPEGKLMEFSKHPITGAQIEGVVIPNWTNIKDEIINIHKKIAFTGIPFIAWDIALTNNGFKVIEGNTSCGLELIQRHKGLRHEELGKLYRDFGIIK